MAFGFDARDLVGPPFQPCPNCGAAEFGVYAVGGQGYSRRCRQCWHKGEFPLPPLSRKVIYIDQFAISNMMKALNTASPRHSTAAADPFWVRLFERLDRVVKLQLAICPDSDVHRHESMVSGFFEALQRMYEQFSRGVSFDSTEEIHQRQLNIALLAWLRGESPQYDFNPERVTRGGLHDWKERYIISVSGEYPQFIIEAIRKFRDAVHVKIRALFEEELRTTPETDFGYWLERERNAGRRTILQTRLMYEQRLQEMAVAGSFNLDNVYASSGLDQFNLIAEVLRRRGTARDELIPRLSAFLESDTYKDYPANHIMSLIWAAIGRAAAGGQKKPPNAGMSNDIHVLTLLPYCDAMFVDNGCRALWEKIPRKYRPPYKARLFSYNTREQFLGYLQEIEAHGDPAVLASVRNVYGEPRPFLTMYEERRRRE